MRLTERRRHEQSLVMYHLNLLLHFALSLRDDFEGYCNEIKPIDRLKSTVSQLLTQVTAVVRENGSIQEEVDSLRTQLARVEENLVEPHSAATGQHHSLQVQYQQITAMLADFKRQLNNMEAKFENHELLLFEANRYIEEQNQEIVRLKRQEEIDREQLNRLQAKVISAEESLKRRNTPPEAGIQSSPRDQEPNSFDGTLLWRINNVSAKMYDSFNEPEKSFYSPPFFTSRHGYKMCARIYLNGDGMGKGTHISLFFVLMRGEFDPLLRWPFRQKVTFMLLDQNNVEHVIDAFRPDPNSSSFQRPRRETNIASGCPLFLPLADLNNHSYIKDDALFIKVIVDCSDL